MFTFVPEQSINYFYYYYHIILVRPSITAISGNQTLNESNDVILSCNATGTPPPNITWSKSSDQDTNFNLGSLLPLRNISRTQDGLYWCTAENGAGKSTASVRVIVQCKCTVVIIRPGPLQQGPRRGRGWGGALPPPPTFLKN